MTKERIKDLCLVYLGKPLCDVESLAKAEKVASGFAWIQDEDQPVSDEQLSADIDEMRAALGIN